MARWIRLKDVEISPEEAREHLVKTRIIAIVLNSGFLFWILALFGSVGPELRAPIALLVLMGCIGTAYCLGNFPPASRLTLLIAGVPIGAVLLLSGEGMLISLGINVLLLVVLLGRMINTNLKYFVDLIRLQIELGQEGARARTAEQGAKALAERFEIALNNMSHGLCLFDSEQR